MTRAAQLEALLLEARAFIASSSLSYAYCYKILERVDAALASPAQDDQNNAAPQVGWLPLTDAPKWVLVNDALVGQWIPGAGRWKKVSIWEPEWTRDDCIRRGATHWWPHLPLLPAPESAGAQASRSAPTDEVAEMVKRKPDLDAPEEDAVQTWIDQAAALLARFARENAELLNCVKEAISSVKGERASAEISGFERGMRKAVEVCEHWPLSAENMNRVAAWPGDWSSKVAGVCRTELPLAILAIIPAEKKERT